MESIGSLAGGIAHDFNNILGGILGHASLMKMKVTEADPLYKSIDTIESSAMRGAELTNQLLAFSRRQKSHFKSVNLNDITLETMKIIRSTFPKSIEVETELQSDLGTIVANESQIHQIVMNLCLNARDAVNEKGIIRIKTSNIFFDAEHVRNYPDAREGRYVLFDITDNGIGMGEETVSRIFEPFYTTKEAGKGTGLGLAMVYGFVKSHEGFVRVESQPGEGSRFQIFFPAGSTGETDRTDVRSRPVNGSETVLIAEDEPAMMDFLRQSLESHGYKVLLARNGMEALEIFKTHEYRIDLVLLDMIMPKMNGNEVLEQLKSTNPEIPILVSSGYSDDHKMKEIDYHGVAGFLQKPFKVMDLLNQIRTILN